MLKKPTREDVEAMVVSHERALFGYTDRDSLRVVPGLLARIDQAHTDIAEVKSDLVLVKATLVGVPDLVLNAQHIKKWGAYGTACIIAGLLAIIFHQYSLWSLITSALPK